MTYNRYPKSIVCSICKSVQDQQRRWRGRVEWVTESREVCCTVWWQGAQMSTWSTPFAPGWDDPVAEWAVHLPQLIIQWVRVIISRLSSSSPTTELAFLTSLLHTLKDLSLLRKNSLLPLVIHRQLFGLADTEVLKVAGTRVETEVWGVESEEEWCQYSKVLLITTSEARPATLTIWVWPVRQSMIQDAVSGWRCIARSFSPANTGEIKELDSHSASLLLQVRKGLGDKEDNGILHTNVWLVSKL